MPKYYCDYCDTFLTHDSPSVRKTHCNGRKHKENVKFYYQKWMEDQAQSLIDATTAAFKANKMVNAKPGLPATLPPFPAGMPIVPPNLPPNLQNLPNLRLPPPGHPMPGLPGAPPMSGLPMPPNVLPPGMPPLNPSIRPPVQVTQPNGGNLSSINPPPLNQPPINQLNPNLNHFIIK